MASDPASYTASLDAVYGNPALRRRFSPRRLAALRRQAEAEKAWVIGREWLRLGRPRQGWPWLQDSVVAEPSLKRAALLAAAWLMPAVPPGWRGPFRPYAD
jgi:hypothetical protein